MRITMVAARGRNGTIGKDGDIPWKLPDDLAHFRRETSGKTVLMGRKTFESLGRPLPRRRNLVLTRDSEFSAEGVETVHRIEELERLGLEELYVIGGEQIYRLFLPLAQAQTLTEVEGEFAGDTFYPEFDRQVWEEVRRQEHPADERHAYPFAFTWLERREQEPPKEPL